MNSNLENIAFHEVIDITGRNYTEFRKKLSPHFKIVKKDILKGYLAILLILSVCLILLKFGLFNWIVFLTGAFLTGYCLAYLHLFIHEAAHYNIHPDPLKNDKIGNYYLGVFFGIRIKQYRKIHWLHHRRLGAPNDTENTYFNELNTRFLLKSLLGVHTLSVVINRSKATSRLHQKPERGYLLYIILFHTCLLLLLFMAGGYTLSGLWLTGLLFFFPFFAALRQLLEHRNADSSAVKKSTHPLRIKISRLFGDNFIENSFGAAGFNKHLIHHWDPVISYTRLREVELFLSGCAATATHIHESKTSYWKTFISLFKLP